VVIILPIPLFHPTSPLGSINLRVHW
jgi:hypothetical protein